MNQTGAPPAEGDPAIDTLQDYVGALTMLRRVRTVLIILLLLSLLVPPAVFACVENGQTRAWLVAPGESGRQLSAVQVAEAGLRLAELLAHGSALLLLVVYFLGVNVCLVGRLGSGRDTMAAIFWMVLLFVLLGSWTGPVFGGQAPRMFFPLDRLIDAAQRVEQGWREAVLHYAGFVGLPVLGALAAVVADMRFGRTYTQAILRLRSRMGIDVRVRM